MRSENEPDNKSIGVKVEVAKNFDKLGYKFDKDIFIEFHAL